MQFIRTIFNRVKFFSFFMICLLLTGCRFIGSKSLNVSVLYFITTLLSIVTLLIYRLYFNKKDSWFFLLLISIIIVNIGYFGISISQTLNFALWANRISYFGSVFLPLSMLMIIIRQTHISHKKQLPYFLILISIFIFLIAASPGYSTVYYKEVTLVQMEGASYLSKVYGPLHSLYLYYLVSYFIGMLLITIKAKKQKLNSDIESLILLMAVFINMIIWLFEQMVSINFEFLSISYIISTFFLIGLEIITSNNKMEIYNYKNQLSSYEKELKSTIKQINELQSTFTEDDINAFKKGLTTLTPTEKIIFQHYINGKSSKDILELLSIKENTLKYHNKNLYSKLCVPSRKKLIDLYNYIEDNKL